MMHESGPTHEPSSLPASGGASVSEREEAHALLREYARTRDLRTRNALVLHHERLVRYLAGRFSPRGAATTEDLVQVGFMGLITAIERYDPEHQVSFATFAAPTIVGVIKHYLRDQTWALKAPRRLRELSLKLRRQRDLLEQSLGRPPSVSELAQAAEVSEERILQAMEVDHLYQPASLDLAPQDGQGEHCGSPYESIGTDDPELAHVDQREAVRGALGRLGHRERTIIARRFFDEVTQAQVASELGISQMHVSRLERRALERLKALLS